MAQIKHQIVVGAPATKVFPLVATCSGNKQWWAADVTETYAAVSEGTNDVAKLTFVELGFFKRSTLYRLQRKRIVEPNEAEW